MPKSQWFKAATAGPTADGRTIKEAWLKDIVDQYDRKEYAANVYLEHIRWYGNFGTVLGAKLGKDNSQRTCLYLQVDATPNLLQLHQNQQYQYPSLGVNPNFKNTGKAYLDHLAAVTQPASVGTETIQFSHDNGTHVELMCFACDEPIDLQWIPEDQAGTEEAPGWFNTFLKKHFSHEDDDMSKEVLEQLQSAVQQLQTDFAALKAASGTTNTPATPADPADADGAGDTNKSTDFATQLNELKQAFAEFKQSQTPAGDLGKGQLEKLEKLEQQIGELANKLEAALQEQPGTHSPKHTGGEPAFSAV